MRRRSPMLLTLLLTAAALAACLAVASPPRPDVPVLRERLDRILSSGYQLSEPPQARFDELVARSLRALREVLGHLSEVEPLAGLPLWVRPVLIGVLLVLLALMVGHIASGLRGLLGGDRDRSSRPEAHRERVDPADVMRDAEEALGRGEHTEALRLLYLAVILRFDRVGVLAHDPARTNLENLRALAGAHPEARDEMARLTRTVDAAVYGGRPASRDTWERARRWAEALWRVEEAA